MDFRNKYIDELIALRAEAREKRNWNLSDNIRDYLDSKHIFVFDTLNEQVVYHRTTGTRKEFVVQLKKEQRAQRLFDAWLFSMNSSMDKKAC